MCVCVCVCVCVVAVEQLIDHTNFCFSELRASGLMRQTEEIFLFYGNIIVALLWCCNECDDSSWGVFITIRKPTSMTN